METLEGVQLTLVIGQYAHKYHLPAVKTSVTETVKSWKDSWPSMLPMPHPSPRNNGWLKKNAWFEEELYPNCSGEYRSFSRAVPADDSQQPATQSVEGGSL